ncbi:MAG: hypothetical protein AVDCRST_MAG93-5560, partial [uncultured Chloroflexia bacterium]
ALPVSDLAVSTRNILTESVSSMTYTSRVRTPSIAQGWARLLFVSPLNVSEDSSCSHLAQTVRVVEHLRTAEYPTPRPLHYGPIPGGGCYYLQERVTGHLMRSPGVYAELNYHELELLLRLLNLHAGIAPEVPQDWTSQVEWVALRHQGVWTVVAQSSLAVFPQLLAVCKQLCAEIDDPGLTHDDLVIGDFGAHNVLLDDHGRVAAVIDFEGAGQGDRVIDLVGLLYMVEPELFPVVRRAALRIASPAAVTACGVYWIVQRLYQGITTNDARLEPTAQQMLTHVDVLT